MPAGASPPAWRTLLSAASDEWRATPFYRMMLGGADPDRIGQWGRDPRCGDATRGGDLAAGLWRIGSERLVGAHAIPWSAPAPSPHFKARLHGFGWLADLAATGPAADAAIADLIQSWVLGFGEWHPEAWAPELVAERLFAWMCHGRPAFEGGDVAVRPALMKSFGRQARHLQLAAGDIRDPLARIKAGATLVMAGCTGMPDGERLADLGVEILEEAAASQFFSDGGHAARSPEALMDAVADFTAADDSLARHGLETPRLVRDLVPKLAAMLRYLSLGDGRLAQFNGGGPGDAATLRALLAEQDETRAFRIAPQSGFHRLAAGDSVLVMDTGAAPAAAYGDRAHAGCLSFEFSTGADRLIVNVGSARDLLPSWRAAGRATNGHSTLIVDDALSAVFETTRLGRAAARPVGPPGVHAQRIDDDDGARIDAQHEGYRADYGLVHRRSVFLDKAGMTLRGLDALARPLSAGKAPAGAPRAPFAIRFHLHPDVRARRIEPTIVHLETPGGAHWRLRTDAPAVAVEDSISLSARPLPAPTKQIVLSGEADPNGSGDAAPNRVRWAFTRIDAPGG